MTESIKEFIKLGYPFAATRVPDVAVEMIIGMMLSRFGREYIAANALMITMQRLFINVPLGAVFPLVVDYANAADDKEKGSITRQGLAFAFFLSVIPTVILAGSTPLLKLFGQDPAVSNVVGDFFIGGIGMTSGMLLKSVLHQFTLGIGRPNISLIINVIDSFFTLGLSYVLAFGVQIGSLNLPAMRALGMGIGHSVSAAVTLLTFAAYFALDKSFKKYELFQWDFGGLDRIKGFLKLGLPFATQLAADFLMAYIATLLLGWLGNNELAAARMAEIVFIIPFMMVARSPQATTIITKKAIPSNNVSLIRQILYANVLTNQVFVILWSAVACGAANQYMRLFIDVDKSQNQPIITLSHHAIWLYALSLVYEVVRLGIAGSYRGFGNTEICMWNSVVFLNVISIPLLFIAYSLNLGLPGIYGARDLGLLMSASVLLFQWINMTFKQQEGEDVNKQPGCFSKAYDVCRNSFSLFGGEKEHRNDDSIQIAINATT